jgi:hypothetical protein
MTAIHDAYHHFLAADESWMRQIAQSLRGRPGDVRYTKAAEGEPGTALRLAYEGFVAAREAWWGLVNGRDSI